MLCAESILVKDAIANVSASQLKIKQDFKAGMQCNYYLILPLGFRK